VSSSALTFSLLSTLLSASAADASVAAAPDPFDEVALAERLWRRSPELAAARDGLIDAEAGQAKARLLPNPTLNASWATIPLGERNPPDHPPGFWDVPNYNVSLGTLIELGKRGPRQRASDAVAAGAKQSLRDAHRLTFFALLEALSDQAASVARAAVLSKLAGDSAEGLRLQRARAERGDVAALEVDRLEVEHLRLLSSLSEAEAAREAAVSACSHLLGGACPRFANDNEARRYLARAAEPLAVPADAVSRRPDVAALAAREAEADAAATLAARQKIPDPTVSVGYQRDQFVVSGNQANSLNVAVSVPLPVFDHGQAEAARARRLKETAVLARASLSEGARAELDLARQRLTLLAGRAAGLDRDAIPRAQNVVERMDAAARRGGAALQDVLLARRALEELRLDRVDVELERFKATVDLRRAAGLVPGPDNVDRGNR
jgi:cobalt-zinc-cadmium efflux system outer membrane protein